MSNIFDKFSVHQCLQYFSHFAGFGPSVRLEAVGLAARQYNNRFFDLTRGYGLVDSVKDKSQMKGIVQVFLYIFRS